MSRALLALSLLLLVACSDRTPTATDDLADGTHVGFVTALDPARARLAFDEAELLEGPEAEDAAEAAGDPPPVGAYVHNPDDRTVQLTIDEDVVVRLLRPCCALHVVSFEDWLAGFAPGDRAFYGTSSSRYEVTIADGKVTRVDELYLE